MSLVEELEGNQFLLSLGLGLHSQVVFVAVVVVVGVAG